MIQTPNDVQNGPIPQQEYSRRSDVPGITVDREILHGCEVTTTNVWSEQAAKKLGKTVGTYITIQTDTALDELGDAFPAGECLAEVLNRVLCAHYHGKLCICGIGNRYVPSDSLGPEVTYNLPLDVYAGREGNFSNVFSFTPGISMTTNMDTEKAVEGVVKAVGADCLLLVDSGMTRDIERLSRTIQISTTGGINSYLSERKADWSALGIPVISLVVPVVIPLSVLVPEQALQDKMLTSTTVGTVIAAAANIIAYAILRVCWPSLSKAECFILSKANKDPTPFSSALGEAFEEDTEKSEELPLH